MNEIIKQRKNKICKVMAFVLCFVLCFSFIPLLDNEAATAEAVETIKIGDYVQMGSYYGEPILWRCVAFYGIRNDGSINLYDTTDTYQEGYLPLLLSDKILCIKAFDASGSDTRGSHSRGQNQGNSRKAAGSNCWEDSNIRCWLNSTASAGNVVWTCGNPPYEQNVMSGFNEYDKEAGFLTNFTHSEVELMKQVKQDQIVDFYEYYNATGSPYFITNTKIEECVSNFNAAYKVEIADKMFLLDVKQANQVFLNGKILGETYYVGKASARCVLNSEYKNANTLLADKNYLYWLRTPYDYFGSSSQTLYINDEGNLGNMQDRYDFIGVRPAFYLDISAIKNMIGEGSEKRPYLFYSDEESSRISCISIKDNSGAELYSVPTGASAAIVTITNMQSSDGLVVFLAEYSDSGQCLGVLQEKASNFVKGATTTIDFKVDNSSGKISKLKAFAVSADAAMRPLGEVVSFPRE